MTFLDNQNHFTSMNFSMDKFFSFVVYVHWILAGSMNVNKWESCYFFQQSKSTSNWSNFEEVAMLKGCLHCFFFKYCEIYQMFVKYFFGIPRSPKYSLFVKFFRSLKTFWRGIHFLFFLTSLYHRSLQQKVRNRWYWKKRYKFCFIHQIFWKYKHLLCLVTTPSAFNTGGSTVSRYVLLKGFLKISSLLTFIIGKFRLRNHTTYLFWKSEVYLFFINYYKFFCMSLFLRWKSFEDGSQLLSKTIISNVIYLFIILAAVLMKIIHSNLLLVDEFYSKWKFLARYQMDLHLQAPGWVFRF